jgi:hypothetical protein
VPAFRRKANLPFRVFRAAQPAPTVSSPRFLRGEAALVPVSFEDAQVVEAAQRVWRQSAPLGASVGSGASQ